MLDFSGLRTLTGGSGAGGGSCVSMGCVRGTGNAEVGKGAAVDWPLGDDRVGLLVQDREGSRLAEEELAALEELRTGEVSREETAEVVVETEPEVVVEEVGRSFGTSPMACV